jgi:hypothetical protein
VFFAQSAEKSCSRERERISAKSWTVRRDKSEKKSEAEICVCLSISPSVIVNKLHTLRSREFSREWQLWRASARPCLSALAGSAWVRTSERASGEMETAQQQHLERRATLSLFLLRMQRHAAGGPPVCIDCD